MQVTITQFRKELFKLADVALRGTPVEFSYKGIVFRLMPEAKPSKLSRLTAENILAPDSDFEGDQRRLLAEMQAEWERDWSEL
jgi:antitoxin (DNA-binding transcriptional repressor) of toxin-antitoxin stability system